MSKRYTFTTPYKDAYEIVDRDIDKAIKPEDVADLLNRQDQRIAELEDRWEDLKQFIEKDHDWNLERGNNDCALGQRWVLDKIEELENGENK